MIVGVIVGIATSLAYIYPIFSGLMLLPLDLLVCNSAPWHYASQILIKNPYMYDSIIQMYPWHNLTYESLRSGIIPLWNPYQFTGMPFMAGLKPMVFYPLNILSVFGEVRSWNLLLFFQLFLAFLFMYLLLRRLTVSVWGSIMGSIAFAYSSLMVCFLEFASDGHTIIWLPFLCYCIVSYAERKKFLYLLGLGLGIASTVFAGHLQMVAYEMICIVGLILFLFAQKRISVKTGIVLFTAVTVGLGISAVQLVPAFELFGYSARGQGETATLFSESLIRAHGFLRLLSPDIFGHPTTNDLHIGYIETGGYYGVIPLFFSLIAFLLWKENRAIRFFCVVFIFSIIFSSYPFGILLSYLRIPLVTSGSGGRLFFLALFSGAVLSGYGLDSVLKSEKLNRVFLSVCLFAGITLSVYIGAFFVSKYIVFFGATLRNLKFSVAVVLAFFTASSLYIFARKKIGLSPWIYALVLLLLTYFDVFRMGYRFLTFSNTKFLYPEIPVIRFVRDSTAKTLGRVYGLTGAEIPSYLHVYALETYNPFYPLRTAALLKALEGKQSSDFPMNVYYLENSEALKHLFDVTGVSLVIAGKDQNPSILYYKSPSFQGSLSRVYSDETHDVYENKDAYPRYRLYYSAKYGMTEGDILDDIRTKKTDLRKTLLLEDALGEPLSEGTGSVQLVSSDVNNQTFSVRTNNSALLYVSDAFFPGWESTVNGKQSKIYRTNYNFRSVFVPEGESVVKFRYQPKSFVTGEIFSLLSLFFLAIIGFFHNALTKNKQNS